MDRSFDYSQKILLAVEFADHPRELAEPPPSHSVFRRIPIPEVTRAFEESHGLAARISGGARFHRAIDEHMGYWEERVPAGRSCYVHYAIGQKEVIDAAYARLCADGGWVLCGVYHIEPQSSSYPFAFPLGAAPDHFHLGEARAFGAGSIFWFNFFPAQPCLFEKTFAIWTLFNSFQGRDGGECNQLTAVDGADRLRVQGVEPFVQVNLNRFTSMLGYFASAHEAGKHTFTVDPEYRWYGMLLRKM
jgi:hypothetical protein